MFWTWFRASWGIRCGSDNISVFTESSLRLLRTRGLRSTREACWSSQLPLVLARSSILLLLTVLKQHWLSFLAAKTALEATFSLVSQSKSVMLCNFRSACWNKVYNFALPVKGLKEWMHEFREDKVFPVLHCTGGNMFVKQNLQMVRLWTSSNLCRTLWQ